MEPLYLTVRKRIYRPDETPVAVQQKACNLEAERLEPDYLTENLRESFAEELSELGLQWRTEVRKGGPYWSLDHQGACVGAELECADLAKYCAKRGIADPNVQGLADSGNLALRSAVSGHYSRTVDASEDTLRDSDGPAMAALAERIIGNWREYLADLTGRMLRDLETDRDYLTSWECIKENAEAGDYGFDDDGDFCLLADCEVQK
jgi:hypothetical protein